MIDHLKMMAAVFIACVVGAGADAADFGPSKGTTYGSDDTRDREAVG